MDIADKMKVAEWASGLNECCVWTQERSQRQVLITRGLVIVGAVLIMAALPLPYVAGFILLTCGIVCLGSAVAIVLSEGRQSKEAFMIWRDSRLWCAIPDDDYVPEKLSREDGGLLRSLVNEHLRHRSISELTMLMDVLKAIDGIESGSECPWCDIDEIKDIEKVATADGETTIFYTDAISGETREISLDAAHWVPFLSWLKEQDPSEEI